jgi:hypothetical protein
MQYEELIYISEDMDLENTHTFLLLAFGMVWLNSFDMF